MAAELTRSGVCYDVKNSPFYQEWDGFRFYFSSESHRRRFYEKVKVKQDWLCDSLTRRFHIRIDASQIAAFQFYIQTETRGFYVVAEDGREFFSPAQVHAVCDVTNDVRSAHLIG